MQEKDIIKISVRTLVEFLLRSGDLDNRIGTGTDPEAMQKGSRLHRKIQKRMGAFYRAEVSLTFQKEYEEFVLQLEGRADGIIEEGDPCVIDEIKSGYFDVEAIEEPKEVHKAQAKCYAYIYGIQENKETMAVQMTYANLETEQIRRFEETYTMEELEQWFMKLLDDYYQWASYAHQWRIIRNESMEHLEFPFPYREGQRDLVHAVYLTIKQGKELFVQAPTGVGKTLSTIFPAVRAMGEGYGERLFYLTAKTITRTVAQEAFGILGKAGLSYKVLTLTAKDKLCVLPEPDCNPVACPRAKGHYDRINEAVYDLWTNESSYDRDTIHEYAQKWNVCPFELSLDLSLWVDGIICDYNYVFDPNVYLRRFFADGVKGSYLFLIDEAHNLVDRGRDMYSAALYKEDVMAVRRFMKNHSKKMDKSLDKLNKQMLSYKRECEDNYQVLPAAGDIYLSALNTMGELEKWMEDQRNRKKTREGHYNPLTEEEEQTLLEFYFQLRDFLNIYDLLDENYVVYSELDQDNHFRIQLFCVNPATNLQRCMEQSAGTIFFSATLLPLPYYKNLLTTKEDDYAVYARSPFSREQRALLIGRDVSSKYTRRGYEEYRKIAQYLSQIAKSHKGNYLVFFPSYRLMEDVFQIYQDEYDDPNVDWIIQTPSMREMDRELFLENFDGENPHTLLGFCVMGGIFAEGIDLIGQRLIGAIIVGTGLPQVSNEREILKNYYDKQGKSGFDYAYRYPGMNKVLQAAGRVIRTDQDRGVIVLLDDRFLQRDYLQLFPREWDQYNICSTNTVMEQLELFWNQ